MSPDGKDKVVGVALLVIWWGVIYLMIRGVV
jgi:hypothetical protein